MARKSLQKPSATIRSLSPAPNLAGWLFPAYLLTIFAGFLLLQVHGAMPAGQEMGQIRALFSAINAATLTGFAQTTDIDKYLPLGQAILFTLIVCGSLFSLIIGGTAVSKILRLGYSDLHLVLAALVAEIGAIGLGTFFLLFDKDQTVARAAFLAASAFGNAGLTLGAGPNPLAWQTHLIVVPLITFGGFGLCVLLELFDVLRRRRTALTPHTRAVLNMTACLYVAATLLLAGLESASHETWPRRLAACAAAAVASRTAGLGLAGVTHLTRPAVWLIILLMSIGGASAGTAGGIKTNTLVELYRGVRRSLAGHAPGRSFGIAAAWVAGFALLIFAGLLLLLHQLPQTPADHVFLDCVSAAANAGISQELLSPDRSVVFTLCAIMMIGRFAPMMVLWWMADTTPDADLAVG